MACSDVAHFHKLLGHIIFRIFFSQYHNCLVFSARQIANNLSPIAKKAECRYSTLERECLAILWGMTKFRLYLAGKPFILQTDHKPLSHLNQAKFQNNQIMRWALAL